MRKKVLLYSGGMDSYILSYLEKPDVCLYIDVDGIYSKKERENLILPPYGKLIIDTLNIGKFERDIGVLPMRNAYFILNAVQYGDDIILGGVEGDRAHDTHKWFTKLMEWLTNYIWKDDRINNRLECRGDIKIHLPSKNKTKIELLKEFIEEGGDPKFLYESISCYDSKILHCGKCKACARKWVAMEHCLIKTEGLFSQNPALYFGPYIEQIENGNYNGQKEDKEILEALTIKKGTGWKEVT